MRSLGQFISTVRARLIRSRLPFKVTVRSFDASRGVKFEVSNLVEYFRVVEHGGETEYTAAMLASLRADDILFDIGANVGMVSLHAAKICATVAFEPDPSYRRRLEVNAALNPSIQVDVEPIAVSAYDGDVVLFTDGDDGISPSLVDQGGRGKVTVAARSLDSLLTEGRLKMPSVIKFDIEGAEILALRGAERLLSSAHKPRMLFIEIHDTLLRGFGSSSEEVQSLLTRYGYTEATYRVRRGDQTHLIVHART